MPKLSPFEKRIKRNVIAREQDFFAITSPGFNRFCKEELIGLDLFHDTDTMVSGGVEFKGHLHDLYKASLHLRTANRILMRVTSFRASNFRTLEKKLSDIPWELYLYEGDVPEVHVTTKKSRLYHTDAVAEFFTQSIQMRFQQTPGLISDKKADDVPRFFVRSENDKFTVSIDASGELLYKRGLKTHGGRAPIRETTAAAALMFAGYDPERPLVDPMCGAGTFSMEASMISKRTPPGWLRSFAFMQWPCFRNTRWMHVRREAERYILKKDTPIIFASDLDGSVVEGLKKGVVHHGFTDAITVMQEDFMDSNPEETGNKKGLVVINPPYGIRIGTKKESRDIFSRICVKLKQDFKGWKVLLIVPDKNLLKQLPFRAKTLAFSHGGLDLTLATGKIQA